MTIQFDQTTLRKTNVLIETGTYFGNFVYRNRNRYAVIHTIELIEELYKKAKNKLAAFPHIHCHLGKSPEILDSILKNIDEPVTFWLDAHYQGYDQADNTKHPLLEELNIIKEHHIKNHMIMIDDVRLFKEYNTSKEEIESILKSINPSYEIKYIMGHVINDIIVANC